MESSTWGYSHVVLDSANCVWHACGYHCYCVSRLNETVSDERVVFSFKERRRGCYQCGAALVLCLCCACCTPFLVLFFFRFFRFFLSIIVSSAIG